MILKSVKFNDILRKGANRLPLLGVLCLALGLFSCESSIYDDEEDCPHGIALRFVYDYHMEPGANAFAANVDCINVFVFDEDGNYVTQFKETSDVLTKDSYRMRIDLENGKYHLLVYGGTACEHSRFNLTPDWTSPERTGQKKDDMLVTLPLNEQGISNIQLHDRYNRTGGLFYGTLDVELTDEDYDRYYREETVYLMNDVNDIQIILQEVSAPYQVDIADYNVQIIDDNFILNSNNQVIATATDTYQPYYKPHYTENRVTGQANYYAEDGTILSEDQTRPVQVACAHMSTSRLFVNHWDSARLLITSEKNKDVNNNPHVVIDIPLIEYLLLARNYGDSWIELDQHTPFETGDYHQEFLDRQSRWTLMFFLQNGKWISTRVAVNSWIVRFDNIDF